MPEKTLIVPGSGVDLERFKPAESPRERTPVTIMFIGGLLKDKGIVESLEAVSLVQKQPGSVRFEVVGGLDMRNPTCIDPELIAEYVDSGKVRQTYDEKIVIRASWDAYELDPAAETPEIR